MLSDTHCHLNILAKTQFDTPLTASDLAQVTSLITAAKQKGVTKIINVGTSLIESLNCIKIATSFQEVWATVGIHPNDLNSNWRSELQQLETYLANHQTYKIVGIGECGLDFHYPNYCVQKQKDAFRAQIELALAYRLPISVHTRAASEETLRCLEEYIPNQIKGVIHCFSEGLDFANQVINWGFAIGIGGTITYPKNDFLRQVVRAVDLNNILLETDAPFLPIQSHRGKTNYPQYIYEIAQYVAELKNCSLNDVASITNSNLFKIFKI